MSAERIAVVGDGGASIHSDQLPEGIDGSVPLPIEFHDGQEPRSTTGDDITDPQFYNRLEQGVESGKDLPTTSAPPVGAFVKAYQEQIDTGATTIISVQPSQALSGTYNSARLAAQQIELENTEVQVHVIDSETISGGQQLLARLAAQWKEEGLTAEQIKSKLRTAIEEERVQVLVAVQDSRYLVAGGRLPERVGKLGDALNLSLLLTVKDGALKPAGIVKTKLRSRKLAKRIKTSKPQKIIVLHANAQEEAERLARSLGEDDTVEVQEVGPVLGVHLGPGALGFATLREP